MIAPTVIQPDCLAGAVIAVGKDGAGLSTEPADVFPLRGADGALWLIGSMVGYSSVDGIVDFICGISDEWQQRLALEPRGPGDANEVAEGGEKIDLGDEGV